MLERTGTDPHTIDYVEAHGTGTRAGDPIELRALAHTYGAGSDRELVVGSVKVNVGHTEAAAGIAGVIKAALMLHRVQIVPHLHLGALSDAIDFDGLGVRVPLEGETWLDDVEPRRVAFNSFGYGGTNGHALLSRHPAEVPRPAVGAERLVFPISAHSGASLKAYAGALADHIEADPQLDLAALAHTLSERRTVHDRVRVVVASSRDELVTSLRAVAGLERPAPRGPVRGPDHAWVFTGMGPQWWGMGQQLYRSDDVFRAKLDQCDAIYRDVAGASLLAEMLRDAETSRITVNALAQRERRLSHER